MKADIYAADLGGCGYGRPLPDSMARWLRLFIHDSIMTQCPKNRLEECDSILQFEMEQAIPELRLDPSWGFGEYLNFASEGKVGTSWDKMV